MIRWNDFILDEVFGPLLSVSDEVRSTRLEDSSVMEDARNDVETIQEIRLKQRPARMAGYQKSDSTGISKDAGRNHSVVWRKKGEA